MSKPAGFKHRDQVRHTDGRRAVVIGEHESKTRCSVLPEVGPKAAVVWEVADLELVSKLTPAAFTAWVADRG